MKTRVEQFRERVAELKAEWDKLQSDLQAERQARQRAQQGLETTDALSPEFAEHGARRSLADLRIDFLEPRVQQRSQQYRDARDALAIAEFNAANPPAPVPTRAERLRKMEESPWAR